MNDKISQDQSASRVYYFLQKDKDWQIKADTSGDNRIVKNEFRAYLLEYGDSQLWNGLKSNDEKEDLIDKFWKTVDTKTTGKIGGGSALSDRNALNEKEFKYLQDNVEASERIEEFMKNVKAPDSFDSTTKKDWKNSVREGLMNKVGLQLKKGSIDDITPEWVQKTYELVAAKATADYAAKNVINEKIGKKYAVGDDATLKSLIDNYISQLEGNVKDASTIIAEITKIVEAYVDTADTNSKESVELLSEYGYDEDGYLNDLQSTVLNESISNQIIGYMPNDTSGIYTEDYAEQVNDMIKAYVESYLEDKIASDFVTLKNFDISTFVKSSDYTNMVEQIQKAQQELRDAKLELNNYILGLLAETESREAKTRAVQAKVGTVDAVGIWNIIDSKKSVEELKQLRSDIEAQLASELAAIEAEKAAKEAAYKQSFGNLAGYIDQIENDNITGMTKSKSSIHTEFGMDANGNIVFESNDATEVYENVVKTIISELRSKNKEAFDAIGEANIKKLIQASWISTYNTYTSSDSNPTARFVSEVLNQFKKILNKLSSNPEYLKVYTSHTAYANGSLTSNLLFYGTNKTFGDDAIWAYDGYRSILSDGGVDWDACSEDGDEYYKVMKMLLNNIKSNGAYKDIDENIITSVFRQAQEAALKTCQNDINDCPYGTTYWVDNAGYEEVYYAGYSEGDNPNSPVAKANVDWRGTTRVGDRSRISPKALVELTLYYFDKLLYAKLAE